jgi:hypothetical protein
MLSRMKSRLWIGVVATLLTVGPAGHAQGFGLGMIGKKDVTINRLLPPTVNLTGKRIRVEASTSPNIKNGDELRSQLKTKLVTSIQKDPRYILNDASPQTILKFTVTNYYTEKWTDSIPGKASRDAYRGKIEVAYQAMDAATGKALDSENLVDTAGYQPSSVPFLDAFHRSAKKQAAEGSENEARDQLITDIVEDMGKRIAPADEPFVAPLPGRKLEPLSSMAVARRWGAVEEGAEKMDKFPKAEDDSYRQYLIALAKEAQAYDLTREFNDKESGKRTDISEKDAQDDFERAQKYLDDAGAIYKDIIAANSKEKEFRPGDARTEDAIAVYAKIDRYRQENSKALASRGSGLPASKSLASAQSEASGQSPLDQVLSMCGSGIDDQSIKDYIASPDFMAAAKASKYHFNFAADPAKLNNGCKANGATYGHLMRQRLGVGGGGASKSTAGKQ